MFWDYFREYRRQPKQLADVLPWASMPEKTVMLCKDHSLLSTWHLDAMDLPGMSTHEQGMVMLRLHGPWKALEDGWGVWLDMHRHPAILPLMKPLKHPVADQLERDHRKTYDPQLWQDTTYLSLWHKAPNPVTDRLKQSLSPMPETDGASALETFHDVTTGVIDVLRGNVRSLMPLADETFLTYLHSLISDDHDPVVMPDFPVHLDDYLGDCSLIPGWQPQLVRDPETGIYLCLLSVKSVPVKVWTLMSAAMKRLPFGFRVSVRWLPQSLASVEKQFTKRQEKLTAKSYGLKAAAFQWFTNHESKLRNRYIEYAADDTDQARFEGLKEDVGYGDLSVTIVLAEADLAVAQAHRREVERVLRSCGLLTVRRWVNATGAWLGTLPGLPLFDPRRLKVSSLNALHVQSGTMWSTPWGGKPTTPALKGPGLMLTKTEDCMPCWFGLYSGDVPHTLISGPSGSGKSTALKMIAAQAQRWDAQGLPQLFWFDHKRSARLFILCMGGRYHDLGRDTIHFQPLRDIDDLHERRDAYTWVVNLVKAAGEEGHQPFTVGMGNLIERTLEKLVQEPQSQRTLTAFWVATQAQSRYLSKNSAPQSVNPETGARDHSRRDQRLDEHAFVREALSPYLQGGIYGHLFDSDCEDIGTNPIQAFEFEALLHSPQLLKPALAHIWRRLYPLFTGVPTLIPIDEAGEQLKYPENCAWVDRGLRQLREKKVALLLATQNHLDFTHSVIGPMLRTNCLNMLLLPNANAIAEDTLPSYLALGLAPREVEISIAGATPKRDAYWVCPEGRRLIQMPASPLEAAICAPSSPEVHDQIDRLLAQVGPEDFPAAWERLYGFEAYAQELDARRSTACHGSSSSS